MVSFNKNIFYNNLNCFVFLSLITNSGKCLPQNSDTSLLKYIKNDFVWDVRRPDLKVNVPKPWLKLDEKSAKQNAKAEEVADPNDAEVGRRMSTKDMKKIDISPSDCGHSENPRIVNGKDAALNAYPWTVVIVRFGEPWCAGNIIRPYWIITAAHCFMKNNSTKHLYIRVGTNVSNKGFRVRAAKIIMHPRFNIDNMYNADISMIKLEKPLLTDRNVRAICLPKYSYAEPAPKKLNVAGWGAKSFISKTMPIQLQEVKLPIISTSRCISRYKEKKVTIYKSQICTWAQGKDACRGDSGGPAVQYLEGRAYLVGIVSYGVTCADKFPGIFTKISYFLEWIKYTIETNTKNIKKMKKPSKNYEVKQGDQGKKKKKISLSLEGDLKGSLKDPSIEGSFKGGFDVNFRDPITGERILNKEEVRTR